MPNYPLSYLTMHARDTILHIQQGKITTEAHGNFQPDWLKIFQENMKKVKKRINYA